MADIFRAPLFVPITEEEDDDLAIFLDWQNRLPLLIAPAVAKPFLGYVCEAVDDDAEEEVASLAWRRAPVNSGPTGGFFGRDYYDLLMQG